MFTYTQTDIINKCNANIEQLRSDVDLSVNSKLGEGWANNVADVTTLINLIQQCKRVGELGIRTEALDVGKYDTDQEWKDKCDELGNELDKYLKLLDEEIARLYIKWQQ